MKDFSHGQQICTSLEQAGMDMTIFGECEPEPSTEGIDSAWASLKGKSFDFFISVGGGSVMDTAKAFRILNAGGGSAWEYTVEMGEDKRPVPSNLIPQIAVPTTSGTGAEVTQVAVVTNKAQKKKAPIVDPEIYPTVAVVDPELTVSMPQYVTATTGFDAFVHAHEHYFGKPELSLLGHQLCSSGMKMVVDNLEKTIQNPDNQDLRTIISWAATQNGLLLGALALGAGSAVHVFALPFGALLGLAHGEGLAISVGPITRFHVQRKISRGQELGEIFGVNTKGLEGEELAETVASALESWQKRIGLKTKLTDYDVSPDMIDAFIESLSLTRVRNCFGPDFSENDIRKIYEECF
jgi:alcohol dehydrogenase class IV